MGFCKKALFSWSGGKDSALALHNICLKKKVEIVSLLTTITSGYGRISMHGVRQELLEKQATSLGIPLEKIFLQKTFSNKEYESKMGEILEKYSKHGVNLVAFGDIFLENLRKHREKKLATKNMKGLFPLWKKNTLKLARNFINLGFKAIITCVDSKKLGKEFVGKEFNRELLSKLPDNVDPCGENGEFHTFVYNGPLFKKPIRFKKGKIVLKKNRFYYCDLIPKHGKKLN